MRYAVHYAHERFHHSQNEFDFFQKIYRPESYTDLNEILFCFFLHVFNCLASIHMWLYSLYISRSFWIEVVYLHSWPSALRPMHSASAFRHPTSQSATEAFRQRTGSPSSGTELVPGSWICILFYSVTGSTGYAGQSGIPAFTKTIRRLKGLHTARQ